MLVDVVTDAAKAFVREYVQDTRDTSVYPDAVACNVFTVWKSLVLGNLKMLITTDLSDTLMYEVTFDADKRDFHLNVYKLVYNKVYTDIFHE